VLLLYLAHIAHNTNDLEAVVMERAEGICNFLLGVIRERRVTFVVSASARRKKNSSVSRKALSASLVLTVVTDKDGMRSVIVGCPQRDSKVSEASGLDRFFRECRR